MKKIILIFCMLMVIIGVTGCTGGKSTSLVTAAQISDKIKSAADISDMKEANAAKLKKFYDIDDSKLDGFILYTAPTNIRADEIAIFKVKNTDDVDEIKGKISKRIEDKSQAFKNYLPEQNALIEKHVLKSDGNYILFVVSKDADKIEAAFDKAVK